AADRVEKDVDALELRDLAEEAEPRPPGVARYLPRRRHMGRLDPVLQHVEPVRRQAPSDIAVDEEAARADEGVGDLKMALDEELALEDPRRRKVGEAAVALGRARAPAELVARRLHHLPVIEADREIFVERDDDPRLRQRAANLEQRFDAEPEHV